MQVVAFIGLGNMGGPMALNLQKAGFQVQAFDLNKEALAIVAEAGATAAASARAAVQGADFVISMLPAGKHVIGLYQDVRSEIKAGALVMDCSTIDAQSARQVGNLLADAGIAFIDAPVSGGVGGAKAGTLTFIVGGSADNFQRAHDVLSAMGKNLFHAGDVGAGQIAKICNNMLLSVLMVGTSEAIQLGVDNGLDPKVLSDIMLKSSGRNWTLELYNPCPDVQPNVPSSNNYQGGFMVDLMAKDLGLASECAQQSQSATPMGAFSTQSLCAASAPGQWQAGFLQYFPFFQ
ncbi:MAG: 3-hydroxyisobutyrate dehydrogenase [Rheinheimera sp.]|nr:3-hydroxyisobutyrate dehydrogenase [Rheinheimera sp.]